MLQIKTKLAGGGRIVIPAEFRQALGLRTGDEVILCLENGTLRLFTPRQATKHAQELLRPYLPQGCSLSDELIAERRLEGDSLGH